MAEDAKQSFPDWKSEGLLLAWLPVATYFVAYAFQLGYCSQFGIPIDLVSVETANIFDCFIYILVFSSFVYAAQRGLASSARATPRKVLIQYGTLLGVGIAVLLTADAEQECYTILFGTLLIFLGDCGHAASQQNSKEPFFARLQGIACFKNRPNHYEPSRVETFIFNVIGMTLVMLIISYTIGYGVATQHGTYYISAKDPSLILISVKDGKAICSKYDPRTKRVLRHIVFLPLEGDKSEFILTNIGRLTF